MARSNLTFLYAAALAVTILSTTPIAASADNDPIPPVDSCASASDSDIGFCSEAHDNSVTTSANRLFRVECG